MAESKTLSWIKSNIVAILVPMASATIAFVISYGASIREETMLLNRLNNLEVTMSIVDAQHDQMKAELDELEDTLREADRAVKDMVINEGRELERTLIRISGQVEGINRRLTFIDGIGAPMIYGPQFEDGPNWSESPNLGSP